MRGEDADLIPKIVMASGSPPHARGRLPLILDAVEKPGITPACAGKTQKSQGSPPSYADHPRMRGEDEFLDVQTGIYDGSPPHARGRRSQTCWGGP